MKKVGIIGGIGPASTLDYYNDIIEGYRQCKQDDEYPRLVIDSINMTEMIHLLEQKRLDNLINLLLDSIKNLENAGADFAAIASNTPHVVFEQVQKRSGLPLISIVEETCKTAQLHNYKTVVILGTKFTMNSGLYTNAFAKYNINAIVPSAEEQEVIHNIIFPNLENGLVLPQEKSKMLSIAEDLIQVHHADALVLGCTELPLMIKKEDIATPLLNTTEIHIQSIIKELL